MRMPPGSTFVRDVRLVRVFNCAKDDSHTVRNTLLVLSPSVNYRFTKIGSMDLVDRRAKNAEV